MPEACISIQIRLLPTHEQAKQLEQTLRAFNVATNYAAEVAFRTKETNKFALQKSVYYYIREQFGLPATMAIQVPGVVATTLKRNKEKQPHFRPLASIPYDRANGWSFKGDDKVSLAVCPKGRLVIPFLCGERQREQLKHKTGEADLLFRDNQWFLLVSVKIPIEVPTAPKEYLGLDLGVVNICTTSEGAIFSNAQVEKKRLDLFRRRRRLGKATKQARRATRRQAHKAIKRLKGKEARYRADINHCISKKLVEDAKRTGRGIALEDLKGIHERVTALRRQQRARHHSWAFSQLRLFIEYKAKLAGVKVVTVDPRHTSQTCPRCGHCEKANRKSQSEFECRQCQYELHADVIGALNVRAKAEGDRPNGTRPSSTKL